MSVFIQKLQEYAQAKNLDKQKELAEMFIEEIQANVDEIEDDLAEIVSSQDESLKTAFAEILFWTRPTDDDDLEAWYSIDLTSYPVFGAFQNNNRRKANFAGVAKIVVKFYQENEEMQEEILRLLTCVENELYFSHDDDPNLSERIIYQQILPSQDEDDE